MTSDILAYQAADLLAEPRLQVFSGRSALVTGGLGFIGSNLVHALNALGASVTVIDSLSDGQGGNRFNLQGIEDLIDIRLADINDEAAVAEAVRGRHYVFNLAASVSHLDSLDAPFRDLDTNVRGNLAVLEAVRRYAPEARVVYAGTRSQYGLIQTSPVTEEHPLLPTEVNSANKAAADLYHFAYHIAHGMATVSLRLTNTYGPRMLTAHWRQGFINWFVRTAVEGGVFKLYGDGSQVRDLVYVDDVVRAHLIAAVTPDVAGQAFNVGSGNPVSLLQIATQLIEIAGQGSIELVPFPDDARRIEIGDYVADTAKIDRILDWQPRISLRQGLERSVRYYQTYREHYW
ncbi:MAG: NAD-dependent epimerase/dehydratase family protein [Dehalococcoidia bacterium]|nr:NAD-dependent epimerase/dehydratase family protein [Dehalococcoidia bacterium]